MLKRGSINSLASTGTGLDSLIGASSALEMSGDDPEYLKRYSEKIAMEAEDSDNDARKEAQMEMRAQAEQQSAKDASADNEDSVEHARMMAAKMNEQMQHGVEEAEKLHH